jgi:hypothetical protein
MFAVRSPTTNKQTIEETEQEGAEYAEKGQKGQKLFSAASTGRFKV